MKFAIHGRVFKSDSSAAIQEIFDELKNNDITYQVSDSFTEILHEAQIQFDDTHIFKNAQDLQGIDIAFSLGGDGSFLETLGLVASNEIPILGINFGRLGFLTDKQYKIDERLMLHTEAKNDFFKSGMNFALNEIAISKTDTSSMIVIHAYIDGEFLNSYWADGLMVATPTGSTGYNLSCGGPLVMPKSENFIITPICPHNLFVRPIIVSSQSKITLKVESRSKNFLVSMDSRAKIIGDDVGEINISLEVFKAKLVKIDGMSFLSTLRKKLNWGDDIRKRN
jgi:NAD+ kinase